MTFISSIVLLLASLQLNPIDCHQGIANVRNIATIRTLHNSKKPIPTAAGMYKPDIFTTLLLGWSKQEKLA